MQNRLQHQRMMQKISESEEAPNIQLPIAHHELSLAFGHIQTQHRVDFNYISELSSANLL
jgi:hypothetical protein